jgi:thymidine phosphorylase
LSEVAGVGERVEPGGRPLAIVHARDEAGAERAAGALRGAVTLGDARDRRSNPVIEAIR